MKFKPKVPLLCCAATLFTLAAANSAGMSAEAPAAGCTVAANPYCNPHSQRIADYVATYLYDPEVQMLRTAVQPGCIDFLSAPQSPPVTVPCEDAFWTTADNNPTCAALADFGYSDVSRACLNKIFHALKFTAAGAQPPQETGAWESGWRYEAYYGIPIPVGSPANQHFIVSTGTLTRTGIGCAAPPCPYAIKADTNTGSAGVPNIDGPVDIVAPQAINYWLRGTEASSTAYAQNLVARWDGHGIPQQINVPPFCYPGRTCYSPWELGQVMFVMRVLQLDTSPLAVHTAAGDTNYAAVFRAMMNQLWAIQYPNGSLPNEYYADNSGFFGYDAENQDGGLLPFSPTAISRVRNAFGCQPLGKCPVP